MIIKNPQYAIIGINGGGTLTLAEATWNNGEYDIAVSSLGIGKNDAAFFTPSTAQDREKLANAGVFAVPNKVAENGVDYWRFTCVNAPTSDITLTYYVVRGMGGAGATIFLCGVYAVPSTPPVVENQVTDEFGNPVTDEFGNPVTAE